MGILYRIYRRLTMSEGDRLIRTQIIEERKYKIMGINDYNEFEVLQCNNCGLMTVYTLVDKEMIGKITYLRYKAICRECNKLTGEIIPMNNETGKVCKKGE